MPRPSQPTDPEDADLCRRDDAYARLVEHNRAARHVTEADVAALDDRFPLLPSLNTCPD
jgi:hypothetical protein